jgi:hypothetical protein
MRYPFEVDTMNQALKALAHERPREGPAELAYRSHYEILGAGTLESGRYRPNYVASGSLSFAPQANTKVQRRGDNYPDTGGDWRSKTTWGKQ